MIATASRGPITRIRLSRVVLGRRLRTVDAYLVDGLLVDSGPAAVAAEMADWCSNQDVRAVVNTHHHEDHSGGNLLLQSSLDLAVAVPSGSVPILRDAPRLQFYRRLVWGQPEPLEAEPLGEVVEMPRHRLAVISTPGHCADHVCFFEPREGWLFGGDLFLHERARYLRADEDAHEIMASLRRVLALRPRLLLCSHAGFVQDPCEAIERKISYWERLIKQGRLLCRQGLSLREVTERLLGAEGLASYVSRGEFSKRNLMRSLLRRSA